MTNEDTAATKGDISRLDGRMGKLDTRMGKLDGRMDALELRMDRLEQKLDESVATLRHEIALAVETLRDVFVTAHREQIEILKEKDRELEHRIERLEQAAGLAA